MKKILVLCICLLNIEANSQIEILNSGTTEDLGRISKIGNTIIVSGNSIAIRSDNEFVTKSTINLPTNPSWNNFFKVYQNKIFILSTALGNLGSKFWVSNDTGVVWQLKLDTANWYSHQFAMFDTLNGLILGGNDQKLTTSDGGSFWSLGTKNVTSPHLLESDRDSSILYADFGGLNFSTDRGITWAWNVFFNGNSFRDLHITNQDSFYVCGDNFGADFLIYSFHGMDSAKVKPHLPGNKIFQCIAPLNVSEIYIGGSTYDSTGQPFGAIFKTTDLGSTWTEYFTNINAHFSDILFLNDSIALICGSNGALLKWNKNTAEPTSVADVVHDIVSLGVYPNPASDKIMFYFNTSASQVATIMIQDAMGRVVAEQKCYTHVGSNNYYFDVHSLPHGLYFSTIRTQNSVKSIKFIKQ